MALFLGWPGILPGEMTGTEKAEEVPVLCKNKTSCTYDFRDFFGCAESPLKRPRAFEKPLLWRNSRDPQRHKTDTETAIGWRMMVWLKNSTNNNEQLY